MPLSTLQRLRHALSRAAEARFTGSAGTCVSNAVTITSPRGTITTESLTTAAAGTQAITMTNTAFLAGDFAVCMVDKNAGGTGTPIISRVDVATAGTVVITIKNIHASVALNGAQTIAFQRVRPNSRTGATQTGINAPG